jgi:hypothetical protein
MEIANITIELTRKVIDPNKLCKILQIVNPMIIAKLPKLTASPCSRPGELFLREKKEWQ